MAVCENRPRQNTVNCPDCGAPSTAYKTAPRVTYYRCKHGHNFKRIRPSER